MACCTCPFSIFIDGIMASNRVFTHLCRAIGAAQKVMSLREAFFMLRKRGGKTADM